MSSSGKRGVSKPGVALMCAGIIVCLAALLFLCATPPLCQYAVIAPTAEGALSQASDKWESVKADVGATGASMYVSARDQSAASAGGEEVSGILYGVEREFFSAHPIRLFSGRLFDPAEYADGSRVVAVNEMTAFRLFPGTEAEGKTVTLLDAEYIVVGVLAGNATVGDGSEFAFYTPYNAVAKSSVSDAILVADCVSLNAGSGGSLENVAKTALGDGCFYDLPKEAMRQSMLLRLVLSIFGFAAIIRLLKAINVVAGRAFAGYAKELDDRYLRDMIWGILLKLIAVAACYAALGFFAVVIVRALIHPMTVFPEWIPDVFVEWKSVWERASALIVGFSKPVVIRTREMSELLLHGMFLRWGMIMTLAGGLLTAIRPPRRDGVEKKIDGGQ